MKSILLIAFITLVGTSAQAQWYPVTSGTTENLHDIFFVDSLTGYCGGGGNAIGELDSNDSGVILRTTDGGESWETIFSADSLAVWNICIVKEKLYAFAHKGWSWYLVSTVLSASPLKWSVRPIPYSPWEPKVYNDAIYFRDYNLKKLEDDTLSTIVHDIVGLFDINKHGLLFVSRETPEGIRIYFSEDHGMTVDTLSPYPSIVSPHQRTFAQARLLPDVFLIYSTYPIGMLSSFDRGKSWTYHYVGYDNPFIIDKDNIFAVRRVVGGQFLIKTNYRESYIDTLYDLDFVPSKIYFYNDTLGFVIGEEGNILRTTNGGGTVGINEAEELKKNIKVFPNPVKGLLRIEVPEGFVIEEMGLLNVEGRQVKRFKKGLTVLEVSDIPAGPYVLRIKTSEGVFTEKVVVE